VSKYRLIRILSPQAIATSHDLRELFPLTIKVNNSINQGRNLIARNQKAGGQIPE
jgi:hypothetical protein